MAELRSVLRQALTGSSMKRWRGMVLLVAFAVILVELPEARALLTAGMLGGVVLGAFLILMRQQSGPPRPRRGTPIVLFPRPVSQVGDLLSRSNMGSARIFI
jgi:hypothetical protein